MVCVGSGNIDSGRHILEDLFDILGIDIERWSRGVNYEHDGIIVYILFPSVLPHHPPIPAPAKPMTMSL